jgi:O-acetylhomoserine/O-acetylserine sulfhydrylase-like pyridoxal-dependent enzyme
VSFRLKGGIAQGRSPVNALTLAQRAVSLGDAETFSARPI